MPNENVLVAFVGVAVGGGGPGSGLMHNGGYKPAQFCPPRCKQAQKSDFWGPISTTRRPDWCYMAPHGFVVFWFRPWQAGKALLPDGTGKSSQNQESEQSSALIVPQLSVVADMTRR